MKLVVNEGPPLDDPCRPSQTAPATAGPASPPKPVAYYEVLNGTSSVARCKTWLAVLEEIRRWPWDTRFTVKLWHSLAPGNTEPVAVMRWRVWRGRSGRWHAQRLPGGGL